MSISGKKDLEKLLRQYRYEEKEISINDYTDSEAEVGLYAYLNLFTVVSDGSTYVVSTNKINRNLQSTEVSNGRSISFGWTLKGLALTYNFTTGSRNLSELGKDLLLVWREHNGLDLERGTKLEDID